MRRVRVAVGQEVRLLRRYGILAAALLTALLWAALLRLLPEPARPVAVEVLAFVQLGVVGYAFAGALVLLEKAERSTLALAVTPLRLGEALLARVLALTAVALLATGVVVGSSGVPVRVAPMALGVVATSAVALLLSLATVASATSVAQWALPSVGPLVVIALPLLTYAGVTSPLLWLLPTHGALVLLRGPRSAVPALTAVVTTALWCWAIGRVAVRRHARWVGTADA